MDQDETTKSESIHPENTHAYATPHKLPPQFIWEINTTTAFKENLKSNNTHRKLEELINSILQQQKKE